MTSASRFLDHNQLKKAVDEGKRIGFVARYSNNLLDNDRPAREIITEQAQVDFIDRATKGIVPMPFLCIYHEDELTKVGETKFLTINGTDKVKFAVGYGLFDVGLERFALELSASKVDLALSHGYWRNAVERDPQNYTLITRYTPHEITVARRKAVANKLTSIEFFISQTKENTMTKTELQETASNMAGLLGTSTEALMEVLLSNNAMAKVIEPVIESKTVEEAGEATEEESVTVEATEATGMTEEDKKVLTKSVELIGQLSETIAELREEVTGLKTTVTALAGQKAVEAVQAEEVSRVASLESILDLASQKLSAVGREDAVVDAKTVGNAPKEAQSKTDNPYGAYSQHVGIGGA